HKIGWAVPIAISSAPPITKPAAVPATARSAVELVAAALVRSTDKVPSTTQNPCSTLVSRATATAPARANAPRALLRNQTDRLLASAASSSEILAGQGFRASWPSPPAAAATASAGGSPSTHRCRSL